MAEHVATLLAPTVGRLQAHDLISRASKRSATNNISLADAIYADEHCAATLTQAGLTRSDLESALRPESCLGATPEFIRRALAAHAAVEAALFPE